jgi:uncharacterized membrane protein
MAGILIIFQIPLQIMYHIIHTMDISIKKNENMQIFCSDRARIIRQLGQ